MNAFIGETIVTLYAAFMTGMWWAAKRRLDDTKDDIAFWKKRYQENEDHIQKLRESKS